MNESIENFLGEDIVDSHDTSFGILECFWQDENAGVAFVGIQTAANPTQTSVVPAALVAANCACLRIGTHRELVQHGPSLPCDSAIPEEFERAVHDYYGTPQPIRIRRAPLHKTVRPPAMAR